jgi:two-component system OmpR family response regulator
MQPLEPVKHRILLVEDDPMVLELLQTRLEIAGYQTFLARDGVQALNVMAEVKPVAMVLDINMPRLDGFGVLNKMRESGAIARVSTMVLTARNKPDDVRQAIALGARDYLAKPFKDEVLLARVARLVRKPNAMAALRRPEPAIRRPPPIDI